MGSWPVDVLWTGSGMRSSGETAVAMVNVDGLGSWEVGNPHHRRIEAGVEARKPSAPS